MAKFDDDSEPGKIDPKLIYQAIAIAFVVVVYGYLFLITVFNI